jgi:hypothetical protein
MSTKSCEKLRTGFVRTKRHSTLAKTKFMIFRTLGKTISENDCHLVYNSTALGHETDSSLLSPIERVHNNSAKKALNS